jgi:hypothetical protein
VLPSVPSGFYSVPLGVHSHGHHGGRMDEESSTCNTMNWRSHLTRILLIDTTGPHVHHLGQNRVTPSIFERIVPIVRLNSTSISSH